MKRENGELAQKAAVFAMLADIEQFYGVDPLTKTQSKMLADMICGNYYYLKISDLRLFSERFKLGLYGKVYNRIDGGVIMEALALYSAERMDEAAGHAQKNASQQKERSGKVNIPALQRMVDTWKEATKDWQPDARKPKVRYRTLEEYAERTGQELDDLKARLTDEAAAKLKESGVDIPADVYTRMYLNQFLYEKNREQ